jgi:hypothetical protein
MPELEETKPIIEEKAITLDKYISADEVQKIGSTPIDKIQISDDAFAVIDFIDKLIKKIEHLRVSAIR